MAFEKDNVTLNCHNNLDNNAIAREESLNTMATRINFGERQHQPRLGLLPPQPRFTGCAASLVCECVKLPSLFFIAQPQPAQPCDSH